MTDPLPALLCTAKGELILCAPAKGGDQPLEEEEEEVGPWFGEGIVVAYSLPSIMETFHAQRHPTQKPQLPRLRAASVSLLRQPAHGQVLARIRLTASSRSNISSMIGGGISSEKRDRIVGLRLGLNRGFDHLDAFALSPICGCALRGAIKVQAP
jgi:hypothetical protein